MPFQFNIEGPETRKARELTQSLQEAQLQRYQQDEQLRQQTQQRQVLPYEDFSIDVNGEKIPFKALPPEQKMQWAKQRQVDWELEQSRKFTKHQADMAKAEVELETNLQKKKDIEAAKYGGNIKPGPDWLPGNLFGKPYSEQQKDIENKILEAEQKRGRAGIQMQALQDDQMPQSYGMPQVVKPTQQQAQQPQATQPQAQQPQATQAGIPQYNTIEDALKAGAKEGDRVIIGGRAGTFKRPK